MACSGVFWKYYSLTLQIFCTPDSGWSLLLFCHLSHKPSRKQAGKLGKGSIKKKKIWNFPDLVWPTHPPLQLQKIWKKNKIFIVLKWFLGNFEQFWKKLFFDPRKCQNTKILNLMFTKCFLPYFLWLTQCAVWLTRCVEQPTHYVVRPTWCMWGVVGWPESVSHPPYMAKINFFTGIFSEGLKKNMEFSRFGLTHPPTLVIMENLEKKIKFLLF